jgi:hypothetical protein
MQSEKHSASAAEFLTLVANAKNVLILARPDANDDEQSAVTALDAFLEDQRKPHTVVAPGFGGKLERMRSFVIGVDLTKTGLASFAHEQRDGKLFLRVTPRDSLFTKSDIEVGETEWRFDLVINIGDAPTPDIYKAFFETVTTVSLSGSPDELTAMLQ